MLARIPHKRTNQSMECTCCEAERRIEHLAPRDSRRCRFFEAGHANRDEADQEEPERPHGEAWEDLHTVAKTIPSVLTTERPCYQGHRRKRPCYQSHRRNVAGMKNWSGILAVTGTEPASRSFKTRCDILTVAGTKSHKTTTRDASTDTASKGEEEGGVASFRIEEPRVRGPGVQKQFGMSHKRWNAYMKAMHGNGSEGDEWEEIEREVSRETEELRGHMDTGQSPTPQRREPGPATLPQGAQLDYLRSRAEQLAALCERSIATGKPIDRTQLSALPTPGPADVRLWPAVEGECEECTDTDTSGQEETGAAAGARKQRRSTEKIKPIWFKIGCPFGHRSALTKTIGGGGAGEASRRSYRCGMCSGRFSQLVPCGCTRPSRNAWPRRRNGGQG